MRIKLATFIFAFMSLFFVMAPPVHAVSCNGAGDDFLWIESWDKYLQCDPANDNTITDFEFPQDIWLVALAVFEILTRVAVFIAVGVIIFAGFKFMIAQGSPERISEAKTIIQDAIIGLVIAVLATTIISFVAGSLV